jgi:protocatechuate 3,4-dioxygenase, beta subunit
MNTTSPAIKAFHIPLSRERFLRAMFKASAGFMLPGFLGEAISATPTVTQGPYYPLADDIPLDKDNDLARVNDGLTLATGVIEHLSGTVYDVSGNPVKNALVELWAADHQGDYLYSTGVGRNAACDANFAGFGQFLTGSSGKFRFRTIKAGLYNGRTRHYHWGVTLPGRTTRVTTQTGWNEIAYSLTGAQWATQNSNDNVFSTVTAAQRASMLLSYTPVTGGAAGEVAATWDYYSALAPVDHTYLGNSGRFEATVVEIVAGPTGTYRAKITIPAYSGYTYELYTSTTLGDTDSSQIPFALTQAGAVGNHKYTAASAGSLSFYVPLKDANTRRFYSVSYRIPGANTGTP